MNAFYTLVRSLSEAMDNSTSILRASTGNMRQHFYIMINSLGVHALNHTHSLASLQRSGLSDQQTLFSTENCTVPEMEPLTKHGSSLYTRLC